MCAVGHPEALRLLCCPKIFVSTVANARDAHRIPESASLSVG